MESTLTIVLILGAPPLVLYLIIYTQKRNVKKLNDNFYAWINNSGFKPMLLDRDQSWNYKHGGIPVDKSEAVYADIGLSSFKNGIIVRGFYSTADQSGNPYFVVHQTETRNQGKRSVTYYRTILGVHIPDTKLQMIINSKLCSDGKGGGNLAVFSSKNKYKLEGHFADFYDIYMPSSSQSETLSMLTPDSLWFILKELVDYDIEINGPMLYIYSYEFMPEQKIGELISELDKLLTETRLRKSDSRLSNYDNALVARTATGVESNSRLLPKNRRILASIAILFIVTVLFYADFKFREYHIGALIQPLALVIVIVVSAVAASRRNSLQKKYNRLMKTPDRLE